MPTDIQSLFNLGVIAMQQGKITAAIEYYQRVLSIDPENFDAHNNLGAAYLYTKNREGALKHYQKVSQMQHTAAAIPRLGVPDYNWWNEALHGVARAGLSTVFRRPSALRRRGMPR